MENIRRYNIYKNNWTNGYYNSIVIGDFENPDVAPIHYSLICSVFLPKTSKNILDSISVIFEKYEEV